ncbi:MAG TPA: ATP-binding protein [Actinocrinis sp.]
MRPNGSVPTLEHRLVRESMLTADLGAAKRARDFTRGALSGWSDEDGELLESITLVASELVTNAVRYATPRATLNSHAGHAGGDPRIGLGLVRESAFVLCMVHDCGGTAPEFEDAALSDCDPLNEVGRGLRIVARLATTWGWTQPDDSGKTVWAIFATPGRGRGRCDHADESASTAALPHRDQLPTLHTTPRTASPCQRTALDTAWRQGDWRRNRPFDDDRPT